ncbi:MAG: chemotaxis protein CheW [Acidobacteria bacterium]|nr:chemotaxis protein CheW [Acidobacteriota bacterium]
MNPLEPILLVKSGQSLFGIELRYVREIVSDFPIFPLPAKFRNISHLTILRGTPYAVLDNEYYLRIEHKNRERLILLIGQMAISADEAVRTISPEQLSRQENKTEHATSFIREVVQFRNRIIPILDIQAILNDRPDFEFIPT